MTTLGRPVVLSEQVVRAVADSIDGGEFRPGSRLPTDRELCARFAVSRAVVREAVARLRADGYIETRQGAGAFVLARPGRLSFRLAGIVPGVREDLGHVMELRLAVEVAAAELAAGRRTEADLEVMRSALADMDEAIRLEADGSEADDRFHVALASATQNPPLRRLVEFLRHQFGATRRPTWSPDGHRAGEPEMAQREHRRLFAAIRAGHPGAARRAAQAHLLSSARRLGLLGGRPPQPAGRPRRSKRPGTS